MENNISDRLREAMNDIGINAAELVRRSGVSKNSISQYLHGKNVPNTKSASLLGTALRVEPLWLMGFDVPKTGVVKEQSLPPYDNIAPLTTHKLPVLGSIACGQPIFMEEQFEFYVEVGTEVKADYLLRAKGDSMINARINNGDIIFIRKQPAVENGQIAAVCIGDEATLKRVYYYPEKQKLVLQAENPKYEPLVYVGEELDQVRILGKAVAFQSDVK